MGDRTLSAIGVLNLQGDVAEHLDHLARLGIEGTPVKEPAALSGLAGLIIPGGESTCLARLMRTFGIAQAIENEFRRGMKIWGTCAGAILMAREVVGEAPCLGLIDLVIERNSFGSQLDSFISEAVIPRVSERPLPLVFIRAPKVLRIGPGVKELLRIDDYIAAAESGEALVTVFHPEMTPSVAFHRYFARKCGLDPYGPDLQPDVDPKWITTSWTRLARII
ncbi:MAG: pyridoxal 5'-phosphate synthase glutaminase subunit PdxT [Deltaproteobacteria bacterium]|nr:pyridoxal 5'-phosphate synthase glutaminase subunit PdxT [Deltaproteobacteria bacterium]